MTAEKKTVFEALGELTHPPQILTVQRAAEGKHQLRLLARALKTRLGATTHHATHEKKKGAADRTKATIEEESALDLGQRRGRRLFVLEGYSHDWATALRPPAGTYVLAETEEGELATTPHSPRRRGEALRALTKVLAQELRADPKSLQLRSLKKLDWAALGSFEEYETLLRKAYLMGWDEERLGQELSPLSRTNLLTAMKRADHHATAELIRRFGYRRAHGIFLANLADLTHYQALRRLGLDEDRAQREMGTSDWEREGIEEAATTLSEEETKQTAERAVRLDQLTARAPALGLELMLYNAPFRVRRQRGN